MEDLLKIVSDLYGIKIPMKYEKVAKGVLSDNYILDTGQEKFFLKKYRFPNEEKIREIHLVKNFFASGGVPVILPIVFEGNKSYFSFRGSCYALFPFVSDGLLEGEDLSDVAVISMAKMLAKIHLLGAKSTLQIRDNTKHPIDKATFLSKANLILEKIEAKNEFNEFDILAREAVLLKKKLVEESSASYLSPESLMLPKNHLLHGDYLAHNLFFNKDDSVSFVFDFEKAGYGRRTYELYRSMFYSLCGGKMTEENMRRSKLYLECYLKEYPMPKDEIENGLRGHLLKEIYNLWVEGEHYLQNNYRPDIFLRENLERVKFFSENFDGALSLFLS